MIEIDRSKKIVYIIFFFVYVLELYVFSKNDNLNLEVK